MFDMEYEIGYVPDLPATRKRPKGQPWCGACATYHSMESGCDDEDER